MSSLAGRDLWTLYFQPQSFNQEWLIYVKLITVIKSGENSLTGMSCPSDQLNLGISLSSFKSQGLHMLTNHSVLFWWIPHHLKTGQVMDTRNFHCFPTIQSWPCVFMFEGGYKTFLYEYFPTELMNNIFSFPRRLQIKSQKISLFRETLSVIF